MEMFIADPHFGHENILKECRPQFHSIEEMDRTLNDNINRKLFPLLKCQMNAGVDINHFEPVTFEELVANNTAFYGRSYTDEETKALERAIAAFSRGTAR